MTVLYNSPVIAFALIQEHIVDNPTRANKDRDQARETVAVMRPLFKHVSSFLLYAKEYSPWSVKQEADQY